MLMRDDTEKDCLFVIGIKVPVNLEYNEIYRGEEFREKDTGEIKMKKLFVITALVIATALYVFTAAKSYEYMDLCFTKNGESPLRMIGVSNPIKGSYVETDHRSVYTWPKGASDKDLYDKNVEDANEPDYYYTLGVESSSTSSYIVTQIQNDGGG